MLGPWKSISGWSIVASSLIEYGRRSLIKIIMLIYLSENGLIVVKFGMLNQLMIMIEVIWPKFKFLTSRWCGRTPYWKTSVLEILASGLSDFLEICTKTQNRELNDGRIWKISNFENSKWQTTAILKVVMSPYFSAMSVIRFGWHFIWCIADSAPTTPTQRSIPPGSVNEYQRKLGSKRAYHVMH